MVKMLKKLLCDELARAVSDRPRLEDLPAELVLAVNDVLVEVAVLLGVSVLLCMPEALGVSVPLLLAVDCGIVVLADPGEMMEADVLGPNQILAEGLLLGVRIRIAITRPGRQHQGTVKEQKRMTCAS